MPALLCTPEEVQAAAPGATVLVREHDRTGRSQNRAALSESPYCSRIEREID